jgi:hypothetical protein
MFAIAALIWLPAEGKDALHEFRLQISKVKAATETAIAILQSGTLLPASSGCWWSGFRSRGNDGGTSHGLCLIKLRRSSLRPD